MRIALTIELFDLSAGGAEGFAGTVAKGLSCSNHEVHIVATRGSVPERDKNCAGINLHIMPFADMPAYIKDRLKPDLTVDWGLNIPADLHRLGGGVHSEFLRYNLLSAKPWLRPFKGAMQKLDINNRKIIKHERALLGRESAKILAVSRFTADQVVRFIPSAADRLMVLHNGVDTHRFLPVDNQDKRRIRHENGIAEDAFVCLFSGHNIRLKNLSLLLDIFPLLHQRNPSVRLVVLGRRCPKLNAPWLIHFPPTAKPERIYQMADLLLHPTYYDACANVVLEALACGVPVISSDLNGSAEIMENGIYGRTLPVSQPGSSATKELWTSHILEMLENPGRALAASHDARLFAEKNDIGHYLKNFTEILESCVK